MFENHVNQQKHFVAVRAWHGDDLGKAFMGGDTSGPEAFVKRSGNQRRGRLYIWLTFSFLLNLRYPFSYEKGRKMKESLGSNLPCCFSGEGTMESLPPYRFSRNAGSLSVS